MEEERWSKGNERGEERRGKGEERRMAGAEILMRDSGWEKEEHKM